MRRPGGGAQPGRVSVRAICEQTGRSRWTVRRWRLGEQYPDPLEHVPALVRLFAPWGLDRDGCYPPLSPDPSSVSPTGQDMP